MQTAVLPLLVGIPLLGAVLCALSGGVAARAAALLTCLAMAGVAGYAALVFDWSLHADQLPVTLATFAPLNASITFAADPLSLLLTLTAVLLSLSAVIASWGRVTPSGPPPGPPAATPPGTAATALPGPAGGLPGTTATLPGTAVAPLTPTTGQPAATAESPAASPAQAAYSEAPADGNTEGTFYAWLMLSLASLTGVFLARDLLLFYAFFELTLVPAFFLIGGFGGPDRRQAAFKLFVYTFAGSVLVLPAILYVGLDAGTFAMHAAISHAQLQMSSDERFWVLLGLLAGFCIKTPVFPLHTWSPAAMTESPASGVVDCAALVLKLGAYALLQIAVPIALVDATGASAFPGVLTTLAVAAVVGVLYAGLIACVQTDMKRLLAYASVSHVGIIVLAVLALTEVGAKAAGFYLISTALSTGALFLIVGMLAHRFGTRDTSELSGLATRMPLLAFFLGLFAMAAIGLPLLSGFVAEFLALLATFTSPNLGPVFGVLASLGIVLGAVYMLTLLARVLFGPEKAPATPQPATDLSPREITALAPLALAVLLLGILPNPVLQTLEPRWPTTAAHAAPDTAGDTAQAAAHAPRVELRALHPPTPSAPLTTPPPPP